MLSISVVELMMVGEVAALLGVTPLHLARPTTRRTIDSWFGAV